MIGPMTDEFIWCRMFCSNYYAKGEPWTRFSVNEVADLFVQVLPVYQDFFVEIWEAFALR